MPIYEYSCPQCEVDFELLIMGSERAACPKCGSKKLSRRVSVPSVHSSVHSRSLPICDSGPAPQCGPGFCRTGNCEFD